MALEKVAAKAATSLIQLEQSDLRGIFYVEVLVGKGEPFVWMFTDSVYSMTFKNRDRQTDAPWGASPDVTPSRWPDVRLCGVSIGSGVLDPRRE